jgi:hypothetical protein
MKITKHHNLSQWEECAKKIKAWEIRLIELRNNGFDYDTCRDTLLKEFPKLKKYFKNNEQLRARMSRTLKDASEAYGRLSAEESFERGQQVIRNAHSRAAMTMTNLLGANHADPIRLNAAKDILDRNAGKATQPIEQRDDSEMDELRELVNNMTKPDANVRKLSKAIKNQGKGTAKG